MLNKNIKYAIYGVNRVAKDFMYIFDEIINVSLFFDDNIDDENFLNRKKYSISDIKKYKNLFDKIIICDFEKEFKKKIMEEKGFIYKKDFYFEEDFFEELDDIKINSENKELVVWGTGVKSEKFLVSNKYLNIKFFIDTYKKQEIFHGKQVFTPDEISNFEDLFIVVAVAKDYDIISALSEKNLVEYRDYCNSSFFDNIPSKLLRKTIFEKKQYDFQCRTLENHIEVLTAGNIFTCCSTIIDRPIGNIRDKNVWDSVIHKIMCLSAKNQTYSFCLKDMCPFFIDKKSTEIPIDNKPYEKMQSKPEVVVIGFDATCNLKCKTCRKEIKITSGMERKKSEDFAEIIKSDMLDDCKFFILAGDGEVFFSPVYKDIYKSEKLNNTEAIRILSNGTLFNEKNWNEFYENKNGKIMLTVSIDAATKETYEKIRCGGNFEQLKKNMKFASMLRREGKLSYFRMNFVVQKENYKEMIPFVNWGIDLNVDEIFFTKILNWGTYTKEEFKEISMMEENGVAPKKELVEILDDPIMKNKIVDLGTIRYAHEAVPDKNIYNYYMWELQRKVPNLFSKYFINEI